MGINGAATLRPLGRALLGTDGRGERIDVAGEPSGRFSMYVAEDRVQFGSGLIAKGFISENVVSKKGGAALAPRVRAVLIRLGEVDHRDQRRRLDREA